MPKQSKARLRRIQALRRRTRFNALDLSEELEDVCREAFPCASEELIEFVTTLAFWTASSVDDSSVLISQVNHKEV